MRRLPLALLLPLALACELKVVDDTEGGGTSSAESSQGSTGETPGGSAASEPAPTTSDPSAATTVATMMTSATATTTTTEATTSTTSASGPTSATTTETDPTADPSATGGVDADEAATQLCVDTINMYRATLGLPPLARWTDAEDCSDAECVSDGMTGTPHGAFGMCGESAQNECPGWPGEPASMIPGCLELMWNEGPGDDFQKHGHFINMSNPNYTRVACGFAPGMGGIWSVQNFQ